MEREKEKEGKERRVGSRGAHSAHVSPLDLGSVKDIYLRCLLGGSNRNYSRPRSGLVHDLHIRLKQYPRVSAAVGRFNAAGGRRQRAEGEFVAFHRDGRRAREVRETEKETWQRESVRWWRCVRLFQLK